MKVPSAAISFMISIPILSMYDGSSDNILTPEPRQSFPVCCAARPREYLRR